MRRRNILLGLLAMACAMAIGALVLWLSSTQSNRAIGGILAGLSCGLVLAAALVWRMPNACDEAPLALRARYMREFLPAMAAYVLAVFTSLWLLQRIDAPALRVLVALLPVPPIAYALRSVMRYIRDVDELQQRIELEAISFATALVTLLYLAGGFLQSARIIDLRTGSTMVMLFPLVCAVYAVAKLVVRRRYL